MRLIVLAVSVAVALSLGPAHADVLFTLDADRTSLDVGDTLRVDVVVPVAGDAFNGYDAILSFDPADFEALLPLPPSAGEGSLFTDACGLRFLDVSDDGDSARVRVSHVLLCAGTSVTGPGTTYSLAFRALDETTSAIALGPGTQAYDAGNLVPTTTGPGLEITVGDPTTSPAPQRVARLHAFPNPFNPSTTLRIEGARGDAARLTIHDATGRLVRALFDGRLTDAALELRWNGRDATGRGVASGIYRARLTTPRGSDVVRLVLVR